ncbi:ABC transporter ATP-binding protein [Oceanicola granulosus HTCC2516]|uniref:ABC transporter ATP-binding protein n=1 Tax=Oceanicola granulosus (strain ATCC BAA-861 / DSM 15982 / KCTC 12143 / HTCC2516) TaxID=314256 RepID=Q2CGL5_OCEGH|nr:ABC transporter ATP-binding protein [Oceanicola granulosus]EAR51703.1 ABC transporter ATP-binding protein [Oceanicola granulosus HTCC2516]
MSAYDLELKKLKKVYPGGTLAVEAFDLQVEKGEFISFVGPSGCGKTTTLRMIAGLESITSGELLIRGKDFTHVRAEQRPTATIFQNYAIFPHMSVAENIAFGLQVRGLDSAEIKRRTDAIIDKLQIGDIRDARESALSGGQKQRVSLARGLVTEPDILLLDEPLGALDANLRKSIQEELKILQRDLGITFIFVTHAQSEALSMGDRVVVMNAGRVEQISSPFDLYTRPKSPFVARFIGRNKIIEGKLEDARDGRARVKTNFGTLAGVPSFDPGRVRPGDDVMLVAPSEYVEITRAGSGVGLQEGHDTVAGTVSSIEPVGQVVYVTVALPGIKPIRIEAYREKIEQAGLEPGGAVDLTWKAERATVVAA